MPFYTSMAPDFVYTSMAQVWPQKMGKPDLKIFLRKRLNYRTKNREFLNSYSLKNVLVSYMVHRLADRGGGFYRFQLPLPRTFTTSTASASTYLVKTN